MEKFKHGDKVTCYICETYIDDAVITIENGIPFICQNYKNGSDCNNKQGYNYSWQLEEDFNDCEVSNLKLVKIITKTKKPIETDGIYHFGHQNVKKAR